MRQKYTSLWHAHGRRQCASSREYLSKLTLCSIRVRLVQSMGKQPNHVRIAQCRLIGEREQSISQVANGKHVIASSNFSRGTSRIKGRYEMHTVVRVILQGPAQFSDSGTARKEDNRWSIFGQPSAPSHANGIWYSHSSRHRDERFRRWRGCLRMRPDD